MPGISDETHARLLTLHAIEALEEVRQWVAQHQPTVEAAVTHGRAESYAAYLEWHSRLDVALKVLGENP